MTLSNQQAKQKSQQTSNQKIAQIQPSIYGMLSSHHRNHVFQAPSMTPTDHQRRARVPGRFGPASPLGESGHQSTGRSWRYPSSLVKMAGLWPLGGINFMIGTWGKWMKMNEHDSLMYFAWSNWSNRILQATGYPIFRLLSKTYEWLKPLWKKWLVSIVRWDYWRVPVFSTNLKIPKYFWWKQCLMKDTARCEGYR